MTSLKIRDHIVFSSFFLSIRSNIKPLKTLSIFCILKQIAFDLSSDMRIRLVSFSGNLVVCLFVLGVLTWSQRFLIFFNNKLIKILVIL